MRSLSYRPRPLVHSAPFVFPESRIAHDRVTPVPARWIDALAHLAGVAGTHLDDPMTRVAVRPTKVNGPDRMATNMPSDE
jgi:hypothetical protein